MERNAIFTDKAAPIGAPYSQAITYNGMMFCSGIVPMKPDGSLITGTIQEQTHQVLTNLTNLLEAAGTSTAKALKVNIFMRDMNDFKDMNEVYAQYFPDPKPARTAVQVARLPLDVGVEIECICAL
ncbi:hypothetical protein BZG36_05417 [Bifiguratus adelaidae]|uniref:Uncharacterized protein n=1 Tax=Bifiguratus adelaidae TaxID=1938954 RepID=A0A261XTE6_9FUNG|nr:hypothetical protein BZG36_05417 [Bifiguratus adelaidae]